MSKLIKIGDLIINLEKVTGVEFVQSDNISRCHVFTDAGPTHQFALVGQDAEEFWKRMCSDSLEITFIENL